MVEQVAKAPVEEIKQEYDDSRTRISKQLNRLELKGLEIQTHINRIEAGIQHLESMIQQELNSSRGPDYNKISSYRGAIAKNIEVITKLYSCYREFEDVRYRCEKELNDQSYKHHRLVEVEIKQVDQKISNLETNDLLAVFSAISKLVNVPDNKLKTEIMEELEQDPEYRME